MNFPVSPEMAGAAACFGLVWGVLSTLLWLWVVVRVITALEGLSRADPGRAARDDEAGAAEVSGVRVGGGVGDVDVGDRAVADEALRTVYFPGESAFSFRPSLDSHIADFFHEPGLLLGIEKFEIVKLGFEQ